MTGWMGLVVLLLFCDVVADVDGKFFLSRSRAAVFLTPGSFRSARTTGLSGSGKKDAKGGPLLLVDVFAAEAVD